MRPTEQIYKDYTEQDFEVWKILFGRQMKSLEKTVSSAYLQALKTIGFSADKIPNFEEVNTTLAALTGWSLEVVPNISAQKDFFSFLSRKKFTATCWLRTLDQLDYIEEPDMFHDVFAHVPLLTNPSYCNFFKGISEIALEHLENPRAVELMGRIYWFTIEFGLIRENREMKIFGAGIISSAGETRHCFNTTVPKLDFDVRTLLQTEFRTDQLQKLYFVIDSFEQLYESLPEIRRILPEMIYES